MFTHGTLSSFKEIMSEVFYDWGMTQSPQIHEDDDGFWINKTSLFKKDGQFYLTYKTTCYEVTESAYNDFHNFYHDLYKGDKEFEDTLEMVSNPFLNNVPLEKKGMEFFIGEFSLTTENYKFHARERNNSGKDFEKEINKVTYQKFSKFFELLMK